MTNLRGMTNLRAEGLPVFRELQPDSPPEDDSDVDFGGGLAPGGCVPDLSDPNHSLGR